MTVTELVSTVITIKSAWHEFYMHFYLKDVFQLEKNITNISKSIRNLYKVPTSLHHAYLNLQNTDTHIFA